MLVASKKTKKKHPAPPAKRQTKEIFMLFIFHREFFIARFSSFLYNSNVNIK